MIVVVANDEDSLEEGLIEHAPDVLRRARVRRVAVRSKVERPLEIPLDGLPLGGGRSQLAVKGSERLRDPILFLAQQVDRDRTGVVGFHQLASFAAEFFLLLFQVGPRVLGLALRACRLCADRFLKLGTEGRVNLNAPVQVFNLPLDLIDQNRALSTGGALGLASCAEEVRVDLPCC
ncbi:MAG: hypothetical protein ACJ71Z_10040 [Aeromicrobium sp.]